MRNLLILIFASCFFLSGCLLRNNTEDVIKITSDNFSEKKLNDNQTISLSTGANLVKSGKFDEAIKFFKEYGDFFSKNPEYNYYLGQAYFKKNLYKEASSNLVKYVYKSDNSTRIPEIRDELNKIAQPAIGNSVIGRISLTDRADVVKNSAIGIKQVFTSDTPVIFASVEVINAKTADKIQAKWNFISGKGEIIPVNSSEFSVSGSKTALLSIKSPASGWITGRYELQILVNEIKNSSLNFYVF